MRMMEAAKMKSKLLKTKSILEVELENDQLGSTIINGIQELSKLNGIIVKQEGLFRKPLFKITWKNGNTRIYS